MKRITPQQKKFVEEYLRSGNATDAAIAAGYSEKTAASRGSKLLDMESVQEYRRELEKELFDKMGISKAWIGRRLAEIVKRCMQETPHMVWNASTRQYEPDGTWQADYKNAISALRQLSAHMGFADGEKDAPEDKEGFEEWLEKQTTKSGL